MNTMQVEKVKLLGILKQNKDAHRTSFLQAQDVYRELVIKELDAMLADARSGSDIRRRVNFRAPEDHTFDYDRVIGLLELSNDKYVDLSLIEYTNFVEDNWSWSRTAKALAANYTARNTSPMFVGEDISLPSSY